MQSLPRAFLLEDDPDIRDIFAAMFRQLGHAVTVVVSVGEAMPLISKGLTAPVVALLDYELPDGRGPQVARALREKFGKQVCIISASARWGPKEQWDAEERKLYDAILLKPFTLAELEAALKSPGSP